MKKILASLTLLLVVFMSPAPVEAQTNFRSGENVSLAEGEVVESDFFAAGERVMVDGSVQGDAYLAGGDVTIRGLVTGDVLVAAGNVTITGTVEGDIRGVAGNLTINGTVGRNITAAGGNISITPESKVGGSATVAAGNVVLLGPLGKGLVVGAGQLTIGNAVGGDVVAGVETMTLAPEAKVDGNVLYWSEKEAALREGAVVAGEMTRRIPEWHEEKYQEKSKAAEWGWITGWTVLNFLTALVLGLLMLKLVPVFVSRTVKTFRSQTMMSLGVGFLALAVTPLAVILLMVTVVGMPLIGLWLFALGVGWWLAKVLASIVVGEWIKKQWKLGWNEYVVYGVGLGVYTLGASVPVLGWFVSFVVGLMGFGAFILTKRDYYRELRQKKLV